MGDIGDTALVDIIGSGKNKIDREGPDNPEGPENPKQTRSPDPPRKRWKMRLIISRKKGDLRSRGLKRCALSA